MDIRTVTDAEYIRQLNKVTFGTPQWLKLQLKYKPLDEVFRIIQGYWKTTITTDAFPWEAHPSRKMRARMQTLLDDTMLWYSDQPNIVSKCKQLKVMQAIAAPRQENQDD
jgi:hypothetical protein